MAKNQDKTVSCNSLGMVISYGDANKHQFIRYPYVKKVQLEGTVKYQKIQKENINSLNPTQKKIYQKLVYGFEAYTSRELNILSEQEKLNVKKTFTVVHKLLNRWKQEIMFSKLDDLLLSLFPNSPVIKAFTETTGYIDDVPEEEVVTFKELGISERQIAEKLVSMNFLPQNFFELA